MLKKMADKYFFDKREWKKKFIKYGVIFGISFLPIVLFNIYCSQYFNKRWLLIFVDCVLILICFVIGNYFANKIIEKKELKLERRQKERRVLQEQKKKIMEDSYKKIRAEKANKKLNKSKSSDEVIVEVVEDDCKIDELSKVSNSKSSSNKSTKNNNTKSNKNNKGRK